jgi:hypothetical protein
MDCFFAPVSQQVYENKGTLKSLMQNEPKNGHETLPRKLDMYFGMSNISGHEPIPGSQ